MCGIAGFNFSDKRLIKKMNDAQKHRGPDGEGVFTDDNVSLGHQRLAVIDLSEAANQPMTYAQYEIVFNGEIYNFQDIKTELIAKNHRFKLQSDTEVILHAYQEWGDACVNKFNGMWAFCIYDRQTQNLFISRDRYGIKPLFYFVDNQRFVFASEIKSVMQHDINLTINKAALNFFFYQKYITGEDTIYNEIKKLLPAHSLNFNLKTKELKISKYYDIEAEIKQAKQIPLAERLKKIEDILPDTVYKRLISDVPVGSFLSGGLDSSYISTVTAQEHKQFDAFSIGFKAQSFDELKYAKTVAQNIGIKHHTEVLDVDEDLIFEVLSRLDEPFGDPSLIPAYLLSKMTRRHVTVALSGDAGDEVFAGYDTYKAYKFAKFIPYFSVKLVRKITRLFPASDKNLSLLYKLSKFADDYDKNIQKRHLNWLSQTDKNMREKLLVNYSDLDISRKGDDLLSLQLNGFEHYMSGDILKKTDTASMLNSLETRIPFLDYRLVPLVLSLPENYKIRRFKTKYLLKKIARKIISKKIINRKKRGFSVPVSLWFKQSEKMQSYITDKTYYTHNLFNYDYTQILLNEHLAGKKDRSRVLWLIFVFNLWYFHNFALNLNSDE